MKFNRKKAFEVFFGSPDISETVIITPISRIYKEIKEHYLPVEKTRGWWEKMEIKNNFNSVSVLNIPQGNIIKDCLRTLNPKEIERVIFLGFCGSLNPTLKIGQIVTPTISYFEDSNSVSLRGNKNKKQFKIKTIFQIILKEKTLKYFQKEEKIDLLDMETYFLYRWGQKHNIQVFSVLVVSDKPLSVPFFICGKNEFKAIQKGIDKMIKKLSSYFRRKIDII